MQTIGNILKRHNVGGALARGVSAAETVEKANDLLREWFGASIQEYAEAAYVKQKILTIVCRGSSTSQEIRLRERQLIQELERALGNRAVERVKYRIEALPSAEKYTTL
jgi:predicted nucleic acid-binding Zn ribbon protein